jgi:hypothetical protein
MPTRPDALMAVFCLPLLGLVLGLVLSAVILRAACNWYNQIAGAQPPRTARHRPEENTGEEGRGVDFDQTTSRDHPEVVRQEQAIPMAYPPGHNPHDADLAWMGKQAEAERVPRAKKPKGVPVPSLGYAVFLVFVSQLVTFLFYLPADMAVRGSVRPAPPPFFPGQVVHPSQPALELVIGMACFMVLLSFVIHTFVQVIMLPTTLGRSLGLSLLQVLICLQIALVVGLLVGGVMLVLWSGGRR